jgi:hypothetical protein
MTSPSVLEVDREHVVQSLCAHYAQDHLSTGELEARFERANRATTSVDLREVLAGLPALGPMVAPPSPLYQLGDRLPMHTATGLPAHEKRYAAIFAEVKKEGAWAPAPLIRARAVFGSVIFDLREAVLPPEGLVIDVDVILGDCKVLLPPGIGADVDCSAVLSSVNDKAQRAQPGAPRVAVRGSGFMADITVQTKLPKKERMESWRKQLKAALFGDDDGSRGM